MEKEVRLRYSESVDLLQRISLEGIPCEWDRSKMKVMGDEFEFRLPWPFPVPGEDQDLEEYAEGLDLIPPAYLVILMQAGHSALGYFEDGELIFHKTIKKYMVRAKQGKAQIGHLNSKGKSKAGSRIRLANTVRFFEDINAKLEEWAVEDEVERILVSVPIRMNPLWFNSKVAPPFPKNDSRIRKIPLDVHRPSHEELIRVNAHGLMGYLKGNPIV